ncbi:MAG: GtrA family protein [Candidatus Caldatribacteriaceae bacterium]
MDVHRDFLQLVKFSLVGVVNTLVDFGVFFFLHGYLRIFYVFAQVISYSCGMINSYFLNKFWTFQSKKKIHFGEISRFVMINFSSLSVSLFILYVVRDRGGWGVAESKILATLGSLFVNFLGNKLWVFAERKY